MLKIVYVGPPVAVTTHVTDIPTDTVFTGRFRGIHSVWIRVKQEGRDSHLLVKLDGTKTEVYFNIGADEGVSDFLLFSNAHLTLGRPCP